MDGHDRIDDDGQKDTDDSQAANRSVGAAELLDAAERYARRMLSLADWIAQELRVCLSPTYKSRHQAKFELSCEWLRRMLRPVVPVPGPQDANVLRGYGVEPISLVSTLSSVTLGDDFTRSTSWLWSLLESPLTGGRLGEDRPSTEYVDGWLEATVLLRVCLESNLPSHRRQSGLTQPGPQESGSQPVDSPGKEPPEEDGPSAEAQDPQRPRCAPMTRTEIARRILNRPKARAREVQGLMERHGLRHEDGKLYTICVDQLEPEAKRRLMRPGS